MQIKILITGGTFDKTYNEITGELQFKDTHLPEMLKTARSRLPIIVRNIMMVDSLDMTDTDRQIILNICKKAEEKHIVITHGTDTMEQTARLLGENIREKTIVLTGALIPFAFGSSDGFFNLGSALSFVQALPEGVYIAMNGRYFNWDNVRKNRELGIFEAIR
ncbi:MAG: asparaginase [Deferribacteres bacterium]|nr:asparaginase [candidate division KSB1 bacterium]MCB9503466.1 asparaginase [Deferribacteres bacterium]